MAGIYVFDTHQYVKKLREAGVDEKIAEVQAEVMKDVIDNNLATKNDIYDLKRDIEALRSELKYDIELIKKDLTIRMGSMFAVAIATTSILISIINKFH